MNKSRFSIRNMMAIAARKRVDALAEQMSRIPAAAKRMVDGIEAMVDALDAVRLVVRCIAGSVRRDDAYLDSDSAPPLA